MNVKSADGVSIHYSAKGAGKTALVFVHGWCCDESYWHPQIEHFAKKFKVVSIDLAGHGESGTQRKDWSMAAFGEDVAAVVKKLGLKRVILIGHSMGGPVILAAARLIPDVVIGLVGVDTFHDLNRKNVKEPAKERVARYRSNFVEASRQAVRTMFVEKSDPKLVERIVADMSSSPSQVGIGALEGMSNFNTATAMESVAAPIRCVCSDYQTFDLESAKQHAPSFELILMSGVGHFVMLEDPATFNRILERIIADFVSLAK